LLAWRGESLRSTGRLDSPVSREAAFLFNNLLFAAFAFVVLLGTMFPLIAEAVRGVKVSVGAPYFNQMSVPIALMLVFLVGIGPALPWRKGSPETVGRKFLWPSVAAAVAGAAFAVAGVRQPLAWLTFVFTVFAFGLLIGEFLGPARARQRMRAEGLWRSLVEVCLANRRRYGGYIVHAGVLLMAVGIAASGSFRKEGEWTIRIGQAQVFGDYALQLDSLWAVKESHRDAVVASVTAFYRGDRQGVHLPRLNYYQSSREPIATPAVREGAREDLYLVLMAYDEGGAHATLKAIVSPLVVWIWVGGIVMGLGVIFGLWPRRRVTVPAGEREPVAVAEEVAR
jgi:cytochrome c-type biogenesis protein CcmF